MRVKVHRNLNNKCLSITACESPYRGLVIAHCDAVVLESVTFRVSEKARQRIIKNKCKEVHSFAVGELIACEKPISRHPVKLKKAKLDRSIIGGESTRHINYNPYQAGYFFDCATGQPVDSLPLTLITTDGLFALALNNVENVSLKVKSTASTTCEV